MKMDAIEFMITSSQSGWQKCSRVPLFCKNCIYDIRNVVKTIDLLSFSS